MDAGVNHQPYRPPDISFETAVVGVGVLVKADVLAEALGVESPAFGVCGVVLVFAEGGYVLKLLGDRDLQMVAGNALVVGDVFNGVEVAIGGVVGVDEEAAGAAPSGAPDSK